MSALSGLPMPGTPTPVAPPPARPAVRLPLTKPLLTYVFLAGVIIIFLVETVLGGSTDLDTLERLGAQVNSLVATGEYWRLLTSMFLHIGLAHIAFNGWALLSLGRDVEGFYGHVRFVIIYLFSGLFGSLAYYLFGSNLLSAGASGAVFGLVGAEIAYFLCNRKLFGRFGRQRLGNLATLVGINLVFGFTIPGINNVAHLGGLFGGLLLGAALAPRYQVDWVWMGVTPTPRLVDRIPRWALPLTTVVAISALILGIWLGNQHWSGSPAMLRQQAQAALDAGDLAGARTLLEQAIDADPNDAESLYSLAVILLRERDLAGATQALETVLTLMPDQPDTQYVLGLAYAESGRYTEARAMLLQFIEQEPTGRRADDARRVLTQLPR